MRDRVLIVDDDETMLQLLASSLKGETFSVEFCSSGVEAVIAYFKALKAGRPFELLVLDCAMPYFDGFRVAKIVRCAESGEERRTKLAFFTAFDRTVERSNLLEEVKADAYWVKDRSIVGVGKLIGEVLVAPPETEG